MLRILIEPIVRAALLEDLGRAGDITSRCGRARRGAHRGGDRGAPARRRRRARSRAARLRAARPGLCASSGCAPTAAASSAARRSRASAAGRGRCWPAERTALNLICRLSGVATATRSLVDAIAGHKAKIVCTRKTTPGLRILEKEAVRLGGGANHRFGLDDAMLIKDNHVALAGGVGAALAAGARPCRASRQDRARSRYAGPARRGARRIGVDAVLLDNMDPPTLRRAVAMVAGRAVTEASGRITRETAPEIAAAGVDLISSGWITHSAPILDLGLDIAGP